MNRQNVTGAGFSQKNSEGGAVKPSITDLTAPPLTVLFYLLYHEFAEFVV